MFYAEVPWECGDKDCERQWHMGVYDFAEDTGNPIYMAYDYDGDWEEIETEDLPSCDEIESAWKRYHEYCVSTGCDPLGSYTGVRRTRTRWDWYRIRFHASIAGAYYMFGQYRKGSKGRWQEDDFSICDDEHKDAFEFACLKPRNQRLYWDGEEMTHDAIERLVSESVDGFGTEKDENRVSFVRPRGRCLSFIQFRIKKKIPISQDKIRSQVKRIAKGFLRHMNKAEG
jgi:hypothetical protein